MITTPEPWEEPTRKSWWNREEMEKKLEEQVTTLIRLTEMMPPQSVAELFAITIPNLTSFMHKELTAAYEQGKREERTNLLTALKAVLGEIVREMETTKLTDIEVCRRLTRFIKEQEDNQDKHE